jgi:hypothetical protein
MEHCWRVLERHWNGALLTDEEAVSNRTKSMRWNGIAPNVKLQKKEYAQHIRLTKKELQQYAKRLKRTKNIEPRHLKIKPESWNLILDHKP